MHYAFMHDAAFSCAWGPCAIHMCLTILGLQSARFCARRTYFWLGPLDSDLHPYAKFWLSHILPQFGKHKVSFLEMSSLKGVQSVQFESVMFFLKGRHHGPCQMGYAVPNFWCIQQWKRARNRVFELLSMPFGPAVYKKRCTSIPERNLKVKIIQRGNSASGSGARTFQNLDKELQNPILQGTYFDIEQVHLGKLTAKDQLAAMSTADIVVGFHGAGLIGGLFMNEGASLIQIIPAHMCAWQQYEFLNIATYSGAVPFTHCVPNRLVKERPEGEAERRQAADQEFSDKEAAMHFQKYLYNVESVLLTAMQLKTILSQSRIAMISGCHNYLEMH